MFKKEFDVIAALNNAKKISSYLSSYLHSRYIRIRDHELNMELE